jgi:transglutaminase-like putative cysteine protease
MHYIITHKTRYDYGEVVPECYNLVRLAPRDLETQRTHSHELTVDPKPDDRSARVDFFGNPVEHFAIHSPHANLTVIAKERVEVLHRPTLELGKTPAWETVARDAYHAKVEVSEFRFASPHIRRNPKFAAYAKPSFTPGRPIGEAGMDLTTRIFDDFNFDSEATTVSTPVEEVFEKKAGVCQDFAHLQLACLRSLNLPARYVSGYLRTLPPPGKPRLVGADASHAWVALFCGALGWIDFDPTNNVIPALDHITIAWGRDYSDVCPVQGVYMGGGVSKLKVEVDVMPVDEIAK